MATALFVCRENSGRSQMAAALVERTGDGHRALSAGSEADRDGQVHQELADQLTGLAAGRRA